MENTITRNSEMTQPISTPSSFPFYGENRHAQFSPVCLRQPSTKSTMDELSASTIEPGTGDDAANFMGSMLIHQSDKSEFFGEQAKHSSMDANFKGPSSNVIFVRRILSLVFPDAIQYEQREDETDPNGSRSSTLSVELDLQVNEFALPSKKRMVELLNSYFCNTHKLYPYFDEELVRHEFVMLETRKFQGARKIYLAIINMLFAMALSTSSLNELSQSQRLKSANIFFQRALKLQSSDILTGHTTESVQIFLLMAQFLQGTSRSMVCWNMLGVAARAAQALGLHRRHSNNGFNVRQIEYRNRLWYAMVAMDM